MKDGVTEWFESLLFANSYSVRLCLTRLTRYTFHGRGKVLPQCSTKRYKLDMTSFCNPLLPTESVSYHTCIQKVAVDQDNQQYQLGRQSLISISVIVTGNVFHRILGRQPLCKGPDWSTAQVGKANCYYPCEREL